MTEKVSAAKLAAAMEGYGRNIDDTLEYHDWDFEGGEGNVWLLIDFCPECGTYQRKSELANHPHDESNFICRLCLRDLGGI